ncbi:unnamed protein product, partial [Prorocentrum cordatum]
AAEAAAAEARREEEEEEEERRAAEEALERGRSRAEAAGASARPEGPPNAGARGARAAAGTPRTSASEPSSKAGSPSLGALDQVLLRATPLGQLCQSYEMGFTDQDLQRRLELQFAKAEGGTPKTAERTQAVSPMISPKPARDGVAFKDPELQRKLEVRRLRAEGGQGMALLTPTLVAAP